MFSPPQINSKHRIVLNYFATYGISVYKHCYSKSPYMYKTVVYQLGCS